MQTEQEPQANDYTTLVEKLQEIEQAVARIESALVPIVQFFEQVKQHPMLSRMLG